MQEFTFNLTATHVRCHSDMFEPNSWSFGGYLWATPSNPYNMSQLDYQQKKTLNASLCGIDIDA
jgi:hypothetical protein